MRIVVMRLKGEMMRGILLAAVIAFGLQIAPASAAQQPVKLVRAVVRLNDGEVWGTLGMAYLCKVVTAGSLRWQADQAELRTERLASVFSEALETSGAQSKVSENLFDDAPTPGLQVGAIITKLDAQVCGLEDSDTGRRVYRGKVTMTTEWQVYDPVRHVVVARVTTTASGEEKTLTRDGLERILLAGFRANARQLATTPEFTTALSAAPPVAAAPLQPISFRSIGGGGAGIAVAAKGAVVIYAGEGSGSGVLISPDGYVLTNHHVAGASGQVRVHWSDGTDTVGDVLRSDARRDVALVRTTPHGSPLAIRQASAQLGETVFAIGTPLSQDLSNTVTRGIISASRTIDGQPWIQSDVAVTHGNSGGPLVDEHGQVLGLTAWGIAPNGASANLNFFIPIDDALKVLALTPQTIAATPPRPATPPARTNPSKR
jgi:serine protease Do